MVGRLTAFWLFHVPGPYWLTQRGLGCVNGRPELSGNRCGVEDSRSCRITLPGTFESSVVVAGRDFIEGAMQLVC